jgi:hypothetical protein
MLAAAWESVSFRGAGNSSSRFYVAELATVAVPLLIDLTPSEIASASACAASGEAGPKRVIAGFAGEVRIH